MKKYELVYARFACQALHRHDGAKMRRTPMCCLVQRRWLFQVRIFPFPSFHFLYVSRIDMRYGKYCKNIMRKDFVQNTG